MELFNIILEGLAKAIRQEKEMKDTQSEKEKIRLSLFTDDLIIYRENPTESQKKNPLLELMNDYSKVV